MSNNDEIDYLLNALDNDNNSTIINLTNNKIKQEKNDILQKLQLNRETLKSFHKIKRIQVLRKS